MAKKTKEKIFVGVVIAAIISLSISLKPSVYAAGGGDEKNAKLTSSDSSQALIKLANDLAGLVKLPSELKNSTVGIYVKSLITGKEIYALNQERPLTPASNTKLVTTYTALNELGTNYDVKTLAVAAQKPLAGVLNGDLYLKGFGDPYFSVSDIDDIVDDISRSGVRTINGDVVGDGTFYDNKAERIQYSGDADVVEPTAPVHALAIEKNTFTVVVSALSTGGLPCNVQTFPRSSGFTIINEAISSGYAKPLDKPANKPLNKPVNKPIIKNTATKNAKGKNIKEKTKPAKKPIPMRQTGKPKKRRADVLKNSFDQNESTRLGDELIYYRRKPTANTGNAQVKSNVKVEITNDSTGRVLIKVSGTLPAGKRVSYRYKSVNPAAIAAGIFYDKLQSDGIKINGMVRTGAAPGQYKVLAGVERPLNEMLKLVLKNSNNFLAENVFKIIGGHNGGRRETAHATIDAINKNLTSDKIFMRGTVINDGSGLSRNNRIPPKTLVGILDASYKDKRIFKTLYPLMAVAGVDGTIRRRMRGTLAEGNVHAKTGTLNRVSSLAGYVQTKDGEMLAFAFLMNGNSSNGAYHAVQDRMAVRLATFSYREDPTIIFNYNPDDSTKNGEDNLEQ